MSFNPLNPIALAKLRTREMADAIKETGRDQSFPEPSDPDITNIGLAFQAALRTRLPVADRAGIYPPGDPSAADPEYLQTAQRVWKVVHDGGREPTDAQLASAFATIETVAGLLRNGGYEKAASTLDSFRAEQGFGPRQAAAPAPTTRGSEPKP
jgi:hypothetical protein